MIRRSRVSLIRVPGAWWTVLFVGVVGFLLAQANWHFRGARTISLDPPAGPGPHFRIRVTNTGPSNEFEARVVEIVGQPAEEPPWPVEWDGTAEVRQSIPYGQSAWLELANPLQVATPPIQGSWQPALAFRKPGGGVVPLRLPARTAPELLASEVEVLIRVTAIGPYTTREQRFALGFDSTAQAVVHIP